MLRQLCLQTFAFGSESERSSRSKRDDDIYDEHCEFQF